MNVIVKIVEFKATLFLGQIPYHSDWRQMASDYSGILRHIASRHRQEGGSIDRFLTENAHK